MMMYQDLAEHVGALVSLLALFAGVSALLLWRMLVRLEKKLDELHQLCCNCREELGERFISRFEFEIHHQDLWGALNRHDHDFRGRVVR
jgi:hypothetical protein